MSEKHKTNLTFPSRTLTITRESTLSARLEVYVTLYHPTRRATDAIQTQHQNIAETIL
ncbi:hypothetical protein [Reichenbachiella sp. MSK19-1]|uniref:hypothetical protein n=1 Tax=Reichenbachiella sp. MSK19-1 TaxID=1897631 RepID=UPI0013140D56|nr:hypothetical protein [Reichenbachiella sp. MSK19-1]